MSATTPLHPDVVVQLTGEDGNSMTILARCRKACRRAGKLDVYAEFQEEATSGDYDHLLGTAMKFFDVN